MSKQITVTDAFSLFRSHVLAGSPCTDVASMFEGSAQIVSVTNDWDSVSHYDQVGRDCYGDVFVVVEHENGEKVLWDGETVLVDPIAIVEGNLGVTF